MATITAGNRSVREVNAEIKALITQGETDILIQEPLAQHNLGVAILEPVHLTFAGSVGYYCAGLSDSPIIDIHGSAGWGVAESLMNGTVTVHGNAGNGAGAAICGGTVVIHGDSAARAGVSMKGGTIVVGGSCGYMTGFMGQRGHIIVCGDAGPAFADSMYETICYVGGSVDDLGNDAIIEEVTDDDLSFLRATLTEHMPEKSNSLANFKKIVAGRQLWNFKKQERDLWRSAL
ncbi:MAG: glutamate synthase [Chloroflexota bacterium]